MLYNCSLIRNSLENAKAHSKAILFMTRFDKTSKKFNLINWPHTDIKTLGTLNNYPVITHFALKQTYYNSSPHPNLITPRWRSRFRDTHNRLAAWCINLWSGVPFVARITTFTYCRLTTYHVGSQCSRNAPKGRFPRSWRGNRDTERNRAVARQRECNRDQLKEMKRGIAARGLSHSVYPLHGARGSV